MLTEILSVVVKVQGNSHPTLSPGDAPDADDDELHEDQGEDGDNLPVFLADIHHDEEVGVLRFHTFLDPLDPLRCLII